MDIETEQTVFARDLAQRPGFFIRRLHQIHLALFVEECAGFDITPVQYSVMSVIVQRPGLDQAQISEEAGVDRATLANVVARLEAAGLLKRITSRLDRRQKLLTLTARGKTVLGRMHEPVTRAHSRTIAALEPEDRAAFMKYLSILIDAGNDFGRAKLRLR
jgi:MarR family transcriptional regulator, lower aerobic nicotinate degradation pathway regulator